jgi:hypothetical protein
MRNAERVMARLTSDAVEIGELYLASRTAALPYLRRAQLR